MSGYERVCSAKLPAGLNLPQLARDFLAATVNKYGTDEDVSYDILKKIHDADCGGEFEVRVFELLTEEQRQYFTVEYSGRLVPAILQDEFSGSKLTRAQDLYADGRDHYRADNLDYFIEGATSIADFSSTGSKVALAAGVVLLGGLALISAPVAATVGTVVVVGTAVYGVGKIVKNGVELATSDTDAEFKDNMRDMGEAVAVTAMAAPFVPKSTKMLRNTARASQAAQFVDAMDISFDDQVLFPARMQIISRGLEGKIGLWVETLLRNLSEDNRMLWVDQSLSYLGDGRFFFNPAPLSQSHS